MLDGGNGGFQVQIFLASCECLLMPLLHDGAKGNPSETAVVGVGDVGICVPPSLLKNRSNNLFFNPQEKRLHYFEGVS